MATASKTAGQKRETPKVAETSSPPELQVEESHVDPDQAPIEIPDDRDTVKRKPVQQFSGKVVRAKPTHGGTVIEMRPEDWANVKIAGHPLVRWDFLQNKFMVPVEALSEEALAYLLEHDANRFEVIDPPTE
jgi:hypothetical protein